MLHYIHVMYFPSVKATPDSEGSVDYVIGANVESPVGPIRCLMQKQTIPIDQGSMPACQLINK